MVMSVEEYVECLAMDTDVLGQKPGPVPLCPPQIPHDLTRARTRAARNQLPLLSHVNLTMPATITITQNVRFIMIKHQVRNRTIAFAGLSGLNRDVPQSGPLSSTWQGNLTVSNLV
jgi:hypothetical protein